MRRPRGGRTAAIEGSRAGERSVEDPGRGSDAKQANAIGSTGKRGLKAGKRRKLVRFSREEIGLSIRRACSLLLIAESSFRYRSCKSSQEALKTRLQELAALSPAALRLSTPPRSPVARGVGHQSQVRSPFVSRRGPFGADETSPEDGLPESVGVTKCNHPRRALELGLCFGCSGRRDPATHLDDGRSIHAGMCGPACRQLDRRGPGNACSRGSISRAQSRILTFDIGTEVTNRDCDAWAWTRNLTLDFIRPRKPVENAYFGSFNGRLRGESLNQKWFRLVDGARRALWAWRRDYNESRPQLALAEYARNLLAWAGC